MIKKILVTTILLLLCTTTLFSNEIGSKVDINIFYHPSITLDNSNDLPIHSSIGSTYDFTPIYFEFSNHQIGPYFSIFHVSNSLVYQNKRLRSFSSFGMGIDYGYIFNNKFKLNSKIAMGIGKLGQSNNKEIYASLALVPAFILKSDKSFDVSISVPINFVYRKYLLSPTIGVGISTSFDWITEYVRQISSN